MDSITQAALGAAVGHACLQDKLGKKALIAGAMLGTLPDLDIVIYPFIDEVQRLYWHRGESHSVWFLLLGSIGIGWLLSRRYREKNIEILQSTTAVFLVLSTHVLIDLFTVYGTQLLAPISRKGFALNNMFIVDPLFTLPLLFGIMGAYFVKKQVIAERINMVGLLLAALYAVWSFSGQSIADQKFRTALNEFHNVKVSRQITSAGPFTTLLWRHIAETPDGFLLGYWSWFDDSSQKIHFQYIPKNAAIVEEIQSTRTFEAVDWFSKGWWFVAKSNDTTAKIVDLRFTEIPAAKDQPYTEWQWPFAWTFNITARQETRLKPVRPAVFEPLKTLRLLGQRVQGKDGWVSPFE
ncbi:metal-dependent hydrolase [Desulforhopalus sp. 52FAK]